MATSKKTPVAKKSPAKKKPASKRGRNPKVDWSLVRNEYIADSTVSYSELAKKYGVTKTAVQKRGTAEKWSELRQIYAEKAFNQFTEKLLDEKSSAQVRHLQHYQNLQALANNSIQDFAERSYERDRKGKLILVDGKPIYKPINTFELEKLARSLQIAINGERVVLGIPTSVSALSDPEGGSVWSGLAEIVKGAEEAINEYEQSIKGNKG